MDFAYVDNVKFPAGQSQEKILDCRNEMVSSSRLQKKVSKIKYTYIADRSVPPRARASLPSVLQLTAGRVVLRRSLPQYTRFGPVWGTHRIISSEEGQLLTKIAADEKKPVFLVTGPQVEDIVHIDVSNEENSNWFHYIRTVNSEAASLRLVREGRELFAVTNACLPPRTPLTLPHTVWPALDTVDEIVGSENCGECEAVYTSAAQLERHQDTQHALSVNTKRAIRFRGSRKKKTPRKKNIKFQESTSKHVELNCEQSSPLNLANAQKPNEDNKYGNKENSKRKEVKKTKQLSCVLCDRVENSYNRHREHTNSHRQADGRYHCLQCTRTYMDYECIRQHVRYKHGPVRYACLHCQLTFQQSSACVSHLLTHTDVKQYICECGKAYKRKQKLRRHIENHHERNTIPKEKKIDNSAYPFLCNICGVRFKRRGALLNHAAARHAGEGAGAAQSVVRYESDYLCPMCDKVYRSAAKRKKHFLTHHPGSPLPPLSGPCTRPRAPSAPRAPAACPAPACARQYLTRARLNRHVREAHPGLDPQQRMIKTHPKDLKPSSSGTDIPVTAVSITDPSVISASFNAASITDVSIMDKQINQLSTVTPSDNVMSEEVPPPPTILFLTTDQHATLFGSQLEDSVTLAVEVLPADGAAVSAACQTYLQFPTTYHVATTTTAGMT